MILEYILCHNSNFYQKCRQIVVMKCNGNWVGGIKNPVKTLIMFLFQSIAIKIEYEKVKAFCTLYK